MRLWPIRHRHDGVTAQRAAMETGVVVARLESVVDRLEGAYDRLEQVLEKAEQAMPRDRSG